MARTNKKEEAKQRVLTPEFRVFFPHLAKPHGYQGAEPKYSVTMGFKKTMDLSVIKLAIKHAKIAEFGPDKDNWPDDVESPVVDGDDEKHANTEGYKNCWVVKASSHQDRKPDLVVLDPDHPKGMRVVEASEIYPGCFAVAQVFARVWEFPKKSGRYGVHFILDHVMKTKDGKAIGGKKSSAEAFAPLTAGTGSGVNSEEEGDDANF